jgi:uncharacterized protein YqcC (DUF446 family)
MICAASAKSKRGRKSCLSLNAGLMYKSRLSSLRKPHSEGRPNNTPKNEPKTKTKTKEERTSMGTTRERIQAKIAEIEDEMKRIGYWQNAPLRPEQYQFHMAFAMDTMAFSQWLQFIFIPRVKNMIETGEKFPPDSQNGAQAVREFDGDDRAQELVDLLSEFDEIIRQGSRGWRKFFG